MSDWGAAEADYLAELGRQPAARAPVTLGETWNAEWQRTRLDTALGTAQIVGEAFVDLRTQVEAAIGRPAHEVLRERGELLGAARTLDDQARMISSLIDQAPADKQEELRKLSDFRARAAERAQKIERDAGDVYSATYGLSGVATSFLAGMTRQAIEPFNVATLPLGGPLKGPVLKILGREFLIGAGTQAVQEPFIQVNREALGLEAGFGHGAMDVLQAGIGQGGFAGLLRAGAAGFRYLKREIPSSRQVGEGADRGVVAGDRAAPDQVGENIVPNFDEGLRSAIETLSDRDLAAAARLAERDQVIEALAPVDTPEGRAAHMAAVDQAAAAIDAHKPIRAYHRTTADPFEQFDPAAPRSHLSFSGDAGIYFSKDPNDPTATVFGTNVVSADVAIRNPAPVVAFRDTTGEYHRAVVTVSEIPERDRNGNMIGAYRIASDENPNKWQAADFGAGIADFVQRANDAGKEGKLRKLIDFEKINADDAADLRAAGYDGVVWDVGTGGKPAQVVALDPHQVNIVGFGREPVLSDLPLPAARDRAPEAVPAAAGDLPAAAAPAKPVGDPALAKEVARVLSEAGGDLDIHIQQPDGQIVKTSAKAALAQVEHDAAAARELRECAGL